MARGRLAGKVAVVTGASAGVGRAIARALGQQGARVGLIARGLDGLEAAAREIRASGGEALVLALDVADAAAVEAAADRVVSEWGSLDVWVNNAMVSVFSPISEMTSGEYRRVTEVTYLGYVHGTLAALKHMRPRNAGVIVQIGSALAYRSIPPRGEHAAVPGRPQPAPETSATGPTGLSARDHGEGSAPRDRAPGAGAVGWLADPQGHSGAEVHPRAPRPLSGPDGLRRAADRQVPPPAPG